MKYFFSILLIFAFGQIVFAQTNTSVKYPHPVKYFPLKIEKQNVKMAYMDVFSQDPNGGTVILFHGKNFNGFYWKDVIARLNFHGYRVIIPDQIGWGKSDRPNLHYSFHQLAENNKKLLDSLDISQVIVIGHSMGGMLATRFALMYPETVEKLVLENPIGLEDYRTFVPYTPLEQVEQNELKATAESVENYQKTYYPEWKPEYKQFSDAQAADLKLKNFPQVAFINAKTFQMIYEQPVVYEFENLKMPTLLVIGQEDRTVVGKARVPKEIINKYGQYPQLGKLIKSKIPNAQLVELEGIGHIPHIQSMEKFEESIIKFLLFNPKK